MVTLRYLLISEGNNSDFMTARGDVFVAAAAAAAAASLNIQYIRHY